MQSDIFNFCLFLVEIFLSFIDFVVELCVLFEYHFIFEFEVLGFSKPYSCFIEILLKRVAVIFESIDFSSVEVDVIFGG